MESVSALSQPFRDAARGGRTINSRQSRKACANPTLLPNPTTVSEWAANPRIATCFADDKAFRGKFLSGLPDAALREVDGRSAPARRVIPVMKRTLPILFAASLLGVSAIAEDKVKAPDNSGKNERDKNHATLTPGDQSNAPADVQITKDIRRMVVDDKSLSMTAKNVKIITAGGKVTLRGPVNTAAEKETVSAHAKMVAGQTAVTDELEVKTTK